MIIRVREGESCTSQDMLVVVLDAFIHGAVLVGRDRKSYFVMIMNTEASLEHQDPTDHQAFCKS